MLTYKKITVLSLLALAVIFLWPHLAAAQDQFGVNALNNVSVYSTRNIFQTISGIINWILGFLGVIVILFFMYAGWLWFSSRGNRDRIEQAKQIMLNAAIGLGIIFVSYALVNFIFRSAYEGFVTGFPGGGGTSTPPPYGGRGLGGGVLESHYPERNATGVPRNTNIYVTFREPIRLSEILATASTCDPVATPCAVNRNNIMLYVAGNVSSNLADGQLLVTASADHKVFEFNPVPDLGNEATPVSYVMQLGDLRTGNGQPVFTLGSYNWLFTVGTELDRTPPQVVSVIPIASTPLATVARNTIVQINFSEAINPMLASGVTPAFTNIHINNGATLVPGKYTISNGYRTVEFVTNDTCGRSSCGVDIYCLPMSVTLTSTVTTNVADMAGNGIDGDKNGTPGPDYSWQFRTNNNIDISAPIMTDMEHSSTWNIYAPIHMTFNKPISPTSVTGAITLSGGENYWPTVSGNVIAINHDPLQTNTDYQINLNSAIKDINQNCWYPCQCQGPNCICSTAGACSAGICTVN